MAERVYYDAAVSIPREQWVALEKSIAQIRCYNRALEDLGSYPTQNTTRDLTLRRYIQIVQARGILKSQGLDRFLQINEKDSAVLYSQEYTIEKRTTQHGSFHETSPVELLFTYKERSQNDCV